MSKELQELTNKIKDIIPEIEELKFGCKVKLAYNEYPSQIIQSCIGKLNCLDYIVDSEDTWHEYKQHDIAELEEIIGRDINLEDVLKCLEDTVAYKVVCSVFKNYLLIGKPGCLNKDAIKWKLNQPLHEQSEETIKELNKLI